MNPISDYRRSTTTSPAVLIPPIPVTDGELLMRFARHGDDAAFTQLVEKHGRLVWTVCWQVLRQHHEIEDAFQATFFILAKRARSIRSCDSLCGWLYRVAYRTALRSRMSSKRKQLMELVNDELSTLDEKLKRIEQDEQRAALMEELHSLPEQYQMPLVLCYLEGKSRRTAAEELGTTVESVKGRLTRGRQLLRHRLIRRGVSLSVAMAAMTIPVKAATASVTPSLVGLTATGAAAWSTLSSKVASTVTTISTNVSTLAHQGTVAMTIASYAKPAIVAIALLTGVSATVAVDSAGKGTPADQGDTVSLAVAADATAGEDIELVAAEGDAVTIAPIETAQAEGKSKQRFVAVGEGTLEVEGGNLRLGQNAKKKGGIIIFDQATGRYAAHPNNSPKAAKSPVMIVDTNEFEINEAHPVGKIRVPAPARVAAPVQFRTAAPAPPADVMIPAMPPIAEFPIAREFNWQFNQEFNVELQLEIAELSSRVSELQLESKELEIAALDREGKEKEQLLQESQKKMAMAEAEKLKIDITKQHAQIEQLRKAIEEQAKEIGEKAKQAGEEAKKAAKAAGEDAKMAAKMAMEEARAAADEARAVIYQKADLAREAAHAQAGAVNYPPFKPTGSAMELKPGSQIRIEAIGVETGVPIDAVFVVEPMGTVALGVDYGRVKVDGLSVIEAEQAIRDHLAKEFENPKVQVTFEGTGTSESRYGD